MLSCLFLRGKYQFFLSHAFLMNRNESVLTPWTRMSTLSLRSHDSWIFSTSIHDRKGCHQKGESISNSKTRRNLVQRSQSDVMRSCPRKSTILADLDTKVWDTVYLEFPLVIFQNMILDLRTNHKKSLIFSKLKSPCCRPFKGLHGLMPTCH